ncbi:MAG: hypothetical protein GYA33_05940 [Thermogutta sp.]|nr:hypothetical protein [Thermogutta sp.]
MVRSAIRRLLLRGNAGLVGRTLCLLAIAAVFSPVLFGGDLPLFRDGGNFYYPLWYYLAQQYRGGKLPLWNPYENVGAPLLANGTTAAFYPGIVLFLLPIPYPAAYAAFLLAHVLLAAWGAERLAGELGCRAETRPLAGMIYALAGPTLFQIHNPIYLVGGAWLPWILAATWRIIDAKECVAELVTRSQAEVDSDRNGRPERRRAIVRPRLGAVRLLAFASAMSVLGGDPQTAYHGALIAGGTWAIVTARRFLAGKRRERKLLQSLRPCVISGGMLAAGFGCAFCLAAVQILPSWHYAGQSDRMLLTKATVGRLWEAPPEENPSDNTWSALRNKHADTVYAFSVAPWRFAELLWRDFGGASVPVHERYLRAFLVEGRWWTPSLYLGVIPFLLALSAIRIRPSRAAGVEPVSKDEAGIFPGDAGTFDAGTFEASKFRVGNSSRGVACDVGVRESASGGNDAAQVWLTWLGLFAATAALGWYGPGAVVNALLTGTTGEDGAIGRFYPPAGGVYWCLVRLLPGYAMFRYPGKWLPLLTIAVACLAALGVERCGTEPRRFRRSASIAVCLSVAGLAAAALVKWSGLWDAMQVPGDVIFGPFRGESAFWHAVASFSGTAALGLIAALVPSKLGKLGSRGGGANLLGRTVIPRRTLIRSISARNRYRRLAALFILLSAADLTLAAKDLVLPVRPPPLPGVLPQTPPRRVWRPFFWYPDAWQQRNSPERLQELIEWDRQTSFGRWGMVQGTANVQHYGTMMPVRYRAFLEAVKTYMAKNGSEEPPGEILQWLRAERLGAERLDRPAKADAGGSQQGGLELERPLPAPRGCQGLYLVDAWRVERQSLLLPNGFSSGATLWADAAAFFFPGGVPRRPEGPSVIEIPYPSEKHAWENDARTAEHGNPIREAAAESLQCLEYAPGDVYLHVRTPDPRLLVFAEQYLPGWRVEVESCLDGTRLAAAPVCVDRLFLGCLLPPGEWRVRWFYRQPGLQWGVWISAISWLAPAIWLATPVVAAKLQRFIAAKLKRPFLVSLRSARRRC